MTATLTYTILLAVIYIARKAYLLIDFDKFFS